VQPWFNHQDLGYDKTNATRVITGELELHHQVGSKVEKSPVPFGFVQK
jgi:hypothetical protein